MPEAINIKANPVSIEKWRLAAQNRGLPLATWIRQIADEECDRQAALVLYRIRHERPHEINALVEEILRQNAIGNCADADKHRNGKRCPTCKQKPYQSVI